MLLRKANGLGRDVDAGHVAREAGHLGRVDSAPATEIENSLAGRVIAQPVEEEFIARARHRIELLVRGVVAILRGIGLVKAAEPIVELCFLELARLGLRLHRKCTLTEGAGPIGRGHVCYPLLNW